MICREPGRRRADVPRVPRALLPFLAACAVPAPAPALHAPPCDDVELVVPAPPDGALELVIAVNGEVCAREPLVSGAPPPAGLLADWCATPSLEPGENSIEVRVVGRRACRAPVARARLRCREPEPD